LIWDFLGFGGKLGNGNFGCGDWTQFSQGVLWGKLGDCIDAFDRGGWMRMTGEELRRASKHLEFSLNS